MSGIDKVEWSFLASLSLVNFVRYFSPFGKNSSNPKGGGISSGRVFKKQGDPG
jgi:hypothetical protein